MFITNQYILKYSHTYTLKYLNTYILTYLHTYIPTHLHTYTLTYLHTYILTHLHTYTLTHKFITLMVFSITNFDLFHNNIDITTDSFISNVDFFITKLLY